MAKPLLNAKELITKYANGECTEEERLLVESWYEQVQSPEFDVSEEFAEAELALAWRNIQSANKKAKKTMPLWKWAGAAASLVLIASVTLLMFNKPQPNPAPMLADVMPGGNKAVLTLSDGRKINLNEAKNGVLAGQSGITITKDSEGLIVYNVAGSSASAGALNTIATPKGGQFQINLPDGTKVWLNAASSLRYPISFQGSGERRVELNGEAYFRVTKDRTKPFIVKTSAQEVEVLGTHFNVNSYANENRTVTTLEEGLVRVRSDRSAKLIKPGEQSIVVSGNIEVGTADMESALAWKDGNIVFKSAAIQQIMRQVERWYDIKVSYEGSPSRRKFTGGMSRDTRLSELLDVLKDSNIAFKMEETPQGKKLTVTN